MRGAAFGGALAVAALVAAAWGAHAQQERVIDLQAFDAGGEFFFMLEREKDQNPTLVLHPGERVKVSLRNIAHEPHNVVLGSPVGEATPLIDPGQVATLHFVVPSDATGTAEYWCEPHREFGMLGEVRFEPMGTATEVPAMGILPGLLAFGGAAAATARARGGQKQDSCTGRG